MMRRTWSRTVNTTATSLSSISPEVDAQTQRRNSSLPSCHEAIEECRELDMRVEWENMRDVLVRSHDDHATPVAIDAPHVENVLAALKIRAEHLFVVTKPIAALPGQKEGRHGLDGELEMALLEDGPDIDHGIDIRACRRISRDGRSGRLGEKLAQGPQP